jgi:hypothetical protein
MNKAISDTGARSLISSAYALSKPESRINAYGKGHAILRCFIWKPMHGESLALS